LSSVWPAGRHHRHAVAERLLHPAVSAVAHQDVGMRQQIVEGDELGHTGVRRHPLRLGVTPQRRDHRHVQIGQGVERRPDQFGESGQGAGDGVAEAVAAPGDDGEAGGLGHVTLRGGGRQTDQVPCACRSLRVAPHGFPGWR
jgi:hypothetical protein